MKKDVYFPLNIKLNQDDTSVSKWYVWKGNQGSIFVGISNEDVKQNEKFVLNTAL